MNEGKVNKEFIFSYLSGSASALQKELIEDWIKNPVNEELFYKWLDEYERQHLHYNADCSVVLFRISLPPIK